MIDYTKLKVSDIKQMLIDEEHYKEEELNKLDLKGKTAWVDLHQKCSYDNESVLEVLTEESESWMPEMKLEPEKPKTDMPRYYDKEWHDFVMSQFAPGELIDGKYPNVNSLRRVVELLLGEIIYSGPCDLRTTMDPENVGKAVVTYEIQILWKLDAYYNPAIDFTDKEIFPLKTFKATASSHIGNTDDIFALFPESIAETRAEGRALRKALRLGVVCFDELTNKKADDFIKKPNVTNGEFVDGKITDQQINSITILCERLNIDLNKFINSGSEEYNDIKEISRSIAAKMLKRLNQYQSSGEESVEIPTNLLKEN